MNCRALPSIAVFALSAPCLAGVTFAPTVSQMTIGVGFVDAGAADPIAAVNSASIDAPPELSFLMMGSSQPGVHAFTASTVFETSSGDRVVFSFEHEVFAADFAAAPFEYAISGSRLTISSEFDVLISLRGVLSGSGAAVAGFNILGDPVPPTFFAVGAEPVEFEILVPAGIHSIAWGALVAPSGGTAGFEGTLTLTAIPAPGTAGLALLAVGIVTFRRRRG